MDLKKDLTSFLDRADKPLIVILGATAAGKTALSIKLAQLFDGEIISTDSRQIYREMPISTDVIQPEETQGVPHHMLEIVAPDQTLSLAEYTDLALEKITEIHARNHIPMLVGGTGLYQSAITEGYDIPRIPPDPTLRAQLTKEAEEKGADHLHQKLAALDPDAAAKIHPNNLRYVIRALEINLTGNQQKVDKKASKSPFQVYKIGVTRPREEIYARINARVDQQVERGLIEEVKALLSKGYDPDLPSMSSLGVKEIIPYIKGEMPLDQCLEKLKQNTRHYAKRQLTWFRRYDDVNWITPDQLKNI